VLVADRYYPSFFTVVTLANRGVDMVSVSHYSRKVDFSEGESLGHNDHMRPLEQASTEEVDEQAGLREHARRDACPRV